MDQIKMNKINWTDFNQVHNDHLENRMIYEAIRTNESIFLNTGTIWLFTSCPKYAKENGQMMTVSKSWAEKYSEIGPKTSKTYYYWGPPDIDDLWEQCQALDDPFLSPEQFQRISLLPKGEMYCPIRQK